MANQCTIIELVCFVLGSLTVIIILHIRMKTMMTMLAILLTSLDIKTVSSQEGSYNVR